MRRISDDSGAVAVIVAVLAVAVFGFAALAIDVGALYQERRQLQNGADAAALSVAQGCAEGACDAAILDASDYVTANHETPTSGPGAPGRGNLETLCGSVTGLDPCTLTADQYPGKYVVARVTSGTAATAEDFTPSLVNVLPGEQAGSPVKARAVARWGGAGGLTARLPVTIRECRYDAIRAAGLPPAPPPQSTWVEGSYPLNDAARTRQRQESIVTHTARPPSEPTCATLASPSPGNFSWLMTDPDTCEATLLDTETPEFDNTPGNDVPSPCRSELQKLVGTVVGVPIYVAPPDAGAGGTYKVDGFAGFFVTGLELAGASSGVNDVKIPSIIGGGDAPCTRSTLCIRGFFVQASMEGEISDTATDRGLTVVQMAY